MRSIFCIPIIYRLRRTVSDSPTASAGTPMTPTRDALSLILICDGDAELAALYQNAKKTRYPRYLTMTQLVDKRKRLRGDELSPMQYKSGRKFGSFRINGPPKSFGPDPITHSTTTTTTTTIPIPFPPLIIIIIIIPRGIDLSCQPLMSFMNPLSFPPNSCNLRPKCVHSYSIEVDTLCTYALWAFLEKHRPRQLLKTATDPGPGVSILVQLILRPAVQPFAPEVFSCSFTTSFHLSYASLYFLFRPNLQIASFSISFVPVLASRVGW